jgi:alkylhydroperoxidase family enzyme
MLSDPECWRALPAAVKGSGQPLPSWARALAGLMPRTTAAMLRLDLIHRTKSPLEPRLRAELRWVGAHANRCAYAESYAAFDARRAGLSEDDLDALRRGDTTRKAPAEKAALEFARKMTVDSAGITDEEFTFLIKEYGERQTAAMVLLMAYANFQDRLLLCLGSPLEAGGPFPPLEVLFARGAYQSRPVELRAAPLYPIDPSTNRPRDEIDPDWAALTYEQLHARLETQRQRMPRLRVPTWAEIQPMLPPGLMRPNRVAWNLVHVAYAPELALPWEILMRANVPETNANLDRIFCVNLFWVTARAVNSPYCLGHTEMLWELGGLPRAQIAGACRVLAGNDWSSFPPAERRALHFARKVSKTPWAVTNPDIEELKHDFGPTRTAAIIWWECRANYMTRVANGFQLGLERDNVLREYVLDPAPRAGR